LGEKQENAGTLKKIPKDFIKSSIKGDKSVRKGGEMQGVRPKVMLSLNSLPQNVKNERPSRNWCGMGAHQKERKKTSWRREDRSGESQSNVLHFTDSRKLRIPKPKRGVLWRLQATKKMKGGRAGN